MATSQHCALGRTGEDLACAELLARGYAILERGYRTPRGEIDIVARHGTTLVFVEVKTRDSERCGSGAEAVTRRKRRQIVSVAEEYLACRRPSAASCRFDVVVVSRDDEGGHAVEVIPSAFTADE